MMPSYIVLTLYALAVTRITTLITHDEITKPFRSWLIARFDPSHRAHRLAVYLLGVPDDDTTGCPWCVSIWSGMAFAPFAWFWPESPWVMIPMLGLAASQVTGMIYTYGRQQ